MNDPPVIPLTERLLHLRAVPVGARLPAPVLGILAAQSRVRVFARGEALVRQGEMVSGLHVLVEGTLGLSADGAGRTVMKPPDSFGFLPLLARVDSPCDAVFDEAAVTLELDGETLFELLEDHVSLLFASLKFIAEELQRELSQLPAEALSFPLDPDPLIPDHALDFIERIFFMRTMSIFATSNLNALAAMSDYLVEARVEPGTVLWTEGAAADDVVMVVSGRLRCSTASGKVFYQGANTVIGGIELLAGKPHWYALEAVTPVLFFRGNQEAFMDLLEENFTMASDFLGLVARALLQLRGRAGTSGPLALTDPRERRPSSRAPARRA